MAKHPTKPQAYLKTDSESTFYKPRLRVFCSLEDPHDSINKWAKKCGKSGLAYILKYSGISKPGYLNNFKENNKAYLIDRKDPDRTLKKLEIGFLHLINVYQQNSSLDAILEDFYQAESFLSSLKIVFQTMDNLPSRFIKIYGTHPNLKIYQINRPEKAAKLCREYFELLKISILKSFFFTTLKIIDDLNQGNN